MITTVTLNPSFDLTLEVGRLVAGAVNRASAERLEAAGKGVNVSRALAAHSVRTRAIAAIGPPSTAQRFCDLFDAPGVLEVVPAPGQVRTNVTVVESGGVVTKVNGPGPRYTAKDVEEVVAAVVDRVAGSSWVVLSGSLPPGVPDDAYARMIAEARLRGCRVALDADGEALRLGVAAAPDLVKPNRRELEEISGAPIVTVRDALAAAETLLEHGAGTVLASLGASGALLVTAAGRVLAAPVALSIEGAVGAGDALLAGFLSSQGDAVEDLARAVAWGAAACRLPGTRMPGPGDVNIREVVVSSAPDLDVVVQGRGVLHRAAPAVGG